MIDLRSQLFWQHWITCGFGCVGFGVGHTLAQFREPILDSVIFLAGLAFWGIGVTGVKHGTAPAPTIPSSTPEEPRRIPNLGRNGWVMLRDGVALEQAVKQVELNVLDPRIKQWAWAVTYENTKMTQRKWCGRKRLWSKPRYVAFIYGMLEDGFIEVINPKDPKSSYKPRGRRGREYIRDLAIERVYRPFPTVDKTEADLQFLRAQMSRRSTVGEGG